MTDSLPSNPHATHLTLFIPSAPVCQPRHFFSKAISHPLKRFRSRKNPAKWQASCASVTQNLFTSTEHLVDFLTNTWNKRPCLFRNLLPNFKFPLTPEELAGLSCEEDVNARIIQGKDTGFYSLQLGPFDEYTFANLPKQDWTLLVHDANQHVPALADLLDEFSFIPNWRVDDVMVSYASPGGSVGPHVDNYDVFLVQGSGRRKWKVSYTPIPAEDEELVENCNVRVLRNGFTVDEEWVLEQGDVLYVPPRFPHHGISLDDECMTYSVGFRAPTMGQLVCGWAQEIAQVDSLYDVFYQDCVEDLTGHLGDPGRISEVAMDRAYKEMMARLAGDDRIKKRFRDWFASEVTMPKRFVDEDEAMSEDEAKSVVQELLQSVEEGKGVEVCQKAGSVFAYLEQHDGVYLYADGSKWRLRDTQVARVLCKRRIDVEQLIALHESVASLQLLLEQLFAAGLLYVEEEEQEDT